MLRAAAERAGCEAVLALAEVKETWDAWPTDEDPWDDYDYEEENEDDEITLGWWTSPDGAGGEPISLYIPPSM